MIDTDNMPKSNSFLRKLEVFVRIIQLSLRICQISVRMPLPNNQLISENIQYNL